MTDSDSKKIIRFISALTFVLSFFVILKMISGVDLKFLSIQVDYLVLLAGSMVFFVLSFVISSKWVSFVFTVFLTYCFKASVFSLIMKVFLLSEVTKIIYYLILSALFLAIIIIFLRDFKNYNINMKSVTIVKIISIYLMILSSFVFLFNFHNFVKNVDLYSGNMMLMSNFIYTAFAFFPAAAALSYFFMKNNAISIVFTAAILFHITVSGFSKLISNIYTVMTDFALFTNPTLDMIVGFLLLKIIFSLAVFISAFIFILFLFKNLEFDRIKVFKV